MTIKKDVQIDVKTTLKNKQVSKNAQKTRTKMCKTEKKKKNLDRYTGR